jgi:hypothetical protein
MPNDMTEPELPFDEDAVEVKTGTGKFIDQPNEETPDEK